MGAPSGLLWLLMALKEASDWGSIMFVRRQSGQRVSDSRTTSRGTIHAEGYDFWMDTPYGRIRIPIEEAAPQAGLAGAGGRPTAPEKPPTLLEAAKHLGEAVVRTVAEWDPLRIGQLLRATTGKEPQVASQAPKVEDTPRSQAVDIFKTIQAGQEKLSQLKTQREVTLELIRDKRTRDLKALDAQIARERLAVEAGLKNATLLTQLEMQRERLAHELEKMERGADLRLREKEVEFGMQMAELEKKAELQRRADEAERDWKERILKMQAEQKARAAAEARDAAERQYWNKYFTAKAAAEQAQAAREKALEESRSLTSEFFDFYRKRGGVWTLPVVRRR